MSEPGLTYIFERGNRIPYWQDFGPHVGVPHGVEFRLFARVSDGRLRLRAPGYGEPGNYGCGAITVKEMDIVAPLKDEVQADYAEAGSGWREQQEGERSMGERIKWTAEGYAECGEQKRVDRVGELERRVEALERDLKAFGTADDMEQWCKSMEMRADAVADQMLALATKIGEMPEVIVDTVKAVHLASGPRWDDLARRVAEIEGRGIGWRQPAGTTLLKNETHTRLLRVECEHEECGRELARLRRVEEAARALQEGSDQYEFLPARRMTMAVRWNALRAALDSEPKR